MQWVVKNKDKMSVITIISICCEHSQKKISFGKAGTAILGGGAILTLEKNFIPNQIIRNKEFHHIMINGI